MGAERTWVRRRPALARAPSPRTQPSPRGRGAGGGGSRGRRRPGPAPSGGRHPPGGRRGRGGWWRPWRVEGVEAPRPHLEVRGVARVGTGLVGRHDLVDRALGVEEHGAQGGPQPTQHGHPRTMGWRKTILPAGVSRVAGRTETLGGLGRWTERGWREVGEGPAEGDGGGAQETNPKAATRASRARGAGPIISDRRTYLPRQGVEKGQRRTSQPSGWPDAAARPPSAGSPPARVGDAQLPLR